MPAANSSTLKPFAIVNAELQQVRELIVRQTRCSNNSTEQLLRQLFCRSGKMIRPSLVLLSGKSCGTVRTIHIAIAAIVEMIHTATLLHDDVIDNARRRRWQRTINDIYGNTSAVLLGDFLLGRIFSMSVALDHKQISAHLAATTMRICQGEMQQNIERQNWNMSEPEYIDIISDKSAALFSSSCYLGALAAEAGQNELQALSDFGLAFGVAFQISDDLVDIIGDEKKTGKTLRNDINNSKLTLPVIHLLAAADDKTRAELIEQLGSKAEAGKDLAEMLERYGSLDYARSRARHFCEKAMHHLAVLQTGPAKNALIETAELLISHCP